MVSQSKDLVDKVQNDLLETESSKLQILEMNVVLICKCDLEKQINCKSGLLKI